MKTRFLLLLAFLSPCFSFAQAKPDTTQIRLLQIRAQALLDSADFWASIEVCDEALQGLGQWQGKHPALAAELLKIRGLCHWNTFDQQTAAQDFEDARRLLQLKKKGKMTLQLLDLLCHTALNRYHMGKRDDAKRLLDSLVRDSKGLPPNYFIAEVYDNLGMWHGEARQLDSAEVYFLKAKAVREQFSGSHPLLMHRSMGWLGILERERGQPLKAIEYFENGLRIAEQHGGNVARRALLLYNIGYAYHDLQELDLALSYIEQGLSLIQAKYGERIPQRNADYYKGLADVYRLKKDFDKAIHFHEKALQLLGTDASPAGEIGKALIRHNLGLVYSDLEQYAVADSLYSLALAGLEKVRQWDPSVLYFILLVSNSKGNVHLYLGQAVEAKRSFQAFIATAEEAYGKGNPILVQYLNNIGLVYQSLGQYVEADAFFEQGMVILQPSAQGGESFDGILSPIEWSYLLWNKAENYFFQYQASGDLTHLRRSHAAFDRYTSFLDHLRSSYREEGSKAGFAAENKIAYEKCLLTLALLNEAEPDSAYFEKAFAYSEKSKAMILLETVHQQTVSEWEGVPPSLIEREQTLRRETQGADDAYFNYLNKKEPDSRELSARQSALFDAKRRYYDFLSLLEKERPKYYQAKYAPGTRSLGHTRQSLLRPGQCLLEYYVGDANVYVLLVRRDTVLLDIVKKDEGFPLEALVQSLRHGITGYHALPDSLKTDSIFEQTRAEYIGAARRLYEGLVAPLAEWLLPSVTIISDGALGYLPFDALLSGEPSNLNNFETYPFFGLSKRLSYCYSATLLLEMSAQLRREPAPQKLLAMAPFYHGTYSELEALFGESEAASGSGMNPALHSKLKNSLDTLAFSGEEVFAVSRMMGGKVLLDTAATEQYFREHAHEYQILHLSTHGRADDEACYLAFSEIKDGTENELLFVRDLYNLSLRADMVVLSACETGLGELHQGEGIISLARGFAYAGARSVFATLWSVDDASTSELFSIFYRELKGEAHKDEALHRAKKEFLGKANGQHQHPFFWAGLCGIGNMGPL